MMDNFQLLLNVRITIFMTIKKSLKKISCIVSLTYIVLHDMTDIFDVLSKSYMYVLQNTGFCVNHLVHKFKFLFETVRFTKKKPKQNYFL
jgi:hypothetical protein